MAGTPQTADKPSSTSRSRHVTILGDDNFGIWKWTLKYNLKALSLYDYVAKEDAHKVDPSKDAEAMFEIISTISDKIKNRVVHCKTAFELYDYIEAMFTNQTAFKTTDLHMKLVNFKFKSADKISEGLSELQTIRSQLENLEEKVSDPMIEGVILSALPPSFKTFVTVWKGRVDTERTVNNLMRNLTSEAEDMKLLNNREDKALVGNTHAPSGNKQGRFKKFDSRYSKNTSGYSKPANVNGDQAKSGTCNYCKKPGHIMKDCFKLRNRRKMEESSNSRKKPNSFANQDSHEGTTQSEVAMAATESNLNSSWLIDSGASRHMTSRREWFSEYKELEEPKSIILGNNETIYAIGEGTINTTLRPIKDVLYVPLVSQNLFSIMSAVRHGIEVVHKDESVLFSDQSGIFMKGYLSGKSYQLDLEIILENPITACIALTIDEWHERFGHISHQKIKDMAKSNVVEGLVLKQGPDVVQCNHCALNKGHSASHASRSTERTAMPGAALHFDTVGPIREASLRGSKYFVLCKDEATDYRMVAFVSDKSLISDEVKKMICQAELQTKQKVLRVISDNGTEFVNQDLQSFLQQRGINHICSAPYTPQQNGFIERDIRTIVESARTMLNQANLKKELWAEAVNTSVYIMNRVPSTGAKQVPYKLWFGKKPNVKHFRKFGQQAVVNRPIHFRNGKWDITGEIMIFVGYTQLFNTYRFYSPEKDQIIISCNVTFLTSRQGSTMTANTNHDQGEIRDGAVLSSNKPAELVESSIGDKEDGDSQRTEIADPGYEDMDIDETQSCDDQATEVDVTGDVSSDTYIYEEAQSSTPRQPIPRPTNIPRELYIGKKQPQIMENRLRPRSATFTKYFDEQLNLTTLEAVDDPTSFTAAMSRSDKNNWYQAMEEEMNSLYKNDVWTLVDRPAGKNIVSNRWVLRIKRKPNGDIDRYRARLVARGFSQIYGEDYFETYAPVVNMNAVRMMFSFAAIENLIIKQFDVKTAFLYGQLDEEVYMEQPEGFSDNSQKVCHLKKSLYGLKQSPRQWNKKFSDFLISIGMKESAFDHCIYYKTEPSRIYIAIYVDDGVIFADNIKDIEYVINELKKRFDIHEVDATSFLGFQIEHGNRGTISLHQESYIGKILRQYNMASSHPIDNPATITRSSVDEVNAEPLDKSVPFREAIGSLMYAANTTRLDIAFPVNVVSRKVAEPNTYDWSRVKRIFRYLANKQDLSLTYGKGEKLDLHAYCDADFAGDESRKSTTGYVIMFGGGPIGWKSQRQQIVSLSSTEAELVSICSAVKEIVWLRQLGQELDFIDKTPTIIYSDNKSAIRLALDERSVGRTRHMGVRAAYTREQVAENNVEIKHVSSQKQLADCLTKPLTTSGFLSNRNKLMLYLSLLFCLSIPCQGAIFEETKPIIWLPTNFYVDAGITEYEIDFLYMNPCLSLETQINSRSTRQAQQGMPPPNYPQQNGQNRGFPPQVLMPPPMIVPQVPVQQPAQVNQQQNAQVNQQLPEQVSQQQNTQVSQQKNAQINQEQTAQVNIQQSRPQPKSTPSEIFKNMDQTIIKHVTDECNTMWTTHFETKIEEMLRVAASRKTGGIFKRHSIIETVESVVCGVCISNLISSIFERINPYSDHNKINHVDNRVKKLEEDGKEFRANFNLTHELQNGILQVMQSFARNQRDQNRQLLHFAALMPRVSWISSFLQTRITTTAVDLRSIIDEMTYGRVAVKELGDMLNIDKLQHVKNGDTQWISVTRLASDIIRFKFAVRERSREAKIYKVSSFRYWDNLTETPSLMSYEGPEYVMYNETNNCLKAVEDQPNGAILDECLLGNFTDSRVQNWKVLVRTPDIRSYNHTCQVKRTLVAHYIYCFPWQIKLKSGKHRAPPYVFRLPISEPFETPVTNYTPKFFKINITNRNEMPAVDSVHMSHFPMGSDAADQISWFERIQQLRKLNEALLNERDTSVKHGPVWWFAITLNILLILITTGLVGYNLLINKEATKTNVQMMSDLAEMRSNYSTVDCNAWIQDPSGSKHIASQSQKLPVNKKNQGPNTEAGHNEFIDINLNQPVEQKPFNPKKSL